MRLTLYPRSLSARVLWLTVSIILLVEIIVLMPSMGRERQAWLWDRIAQAQLAASSLSANQGPAGGATDAGAAGAADISARQALLKLSGVEAIKLIGYGKKIALMPDAVAGQFDGGIDLDQESLLASIWQSDLAVFGLGGKYLPVTASSPLQPDMQVKIIVSRPALSAHLRRYVAHIAILSVVLAFITGGVAFFSLDRLLVRPMRIMTANIVGFRRNPEYAGLSSLKWLSQGGNNEISGAARELVAMQDELRAALWRNARLAALGTAVAKISHDLRNILSSALLVADRLQGNGDPIVKQAANTLIPAVERAVELVSRTVDFAREGPPAITRSPVVLRELVDEVAQVIRPDDGILVIENLIPGSLVLTLDRTQIYRVLINLLRNAAEAGASRITLSIEGENGMTRMVVADNGRGVPEKVIANLFRPFTGSGRYGGTGLGLAIARDLIRAHGGDLVLRKTGCNGAEFVMGLAATDDMDG